MRSFRAASLALLVTVGTTGCTDIENALARVPFLAFMHSSPAYDPYEAPRPAPPGSVPVRDPFGTAAHAEGNSQTALQELASRVTNPVAADSASLASGQIFYDRFCTVCHGPAGAGDGSILGPGRFPFAPAIATPIVAGYSDEYIYAVVRQGRGLMPAYGPRMTETQRWQVVNYVRWLARAAGQGTAPANPTSATNPTAATGTTAAPATGAPAASDTASPQR